MFRQDHRHCLFPRKIVIFLLAGMKNLWRYLFSLTFVSSSSPSCRSEFFPRCRSEKVPFTWSIPASSTGEGSRIADLQQKVVNIFWSTFFKSIGSKYYPEIISLRRLFLQAVWGSKLNFVSDLFLYVSVFVLLCLSLSFFFCLLLSQSVSVCNHACLYLSQYLSHLLLPGRWLWRRNRW